MELKDALKNRKSIRKYKPKKISDEHISLLLGAAQLAPAAANIQNSRFVLVEDEKKRKKIAEACLNQSWMAQAPLYIVICSENTELKREFNKYQEKFAIQNSAAAIENILLKATELKLGSCWISVYGEKTVKKVLKIPDNIDIQSIITIGYANEKPLRKQKTRLKHIIFFDEYGNENYPGLFPFKK